MIEIREKECDRNDVQYNDYLYAQKFRRIIKTTKLLRLMTCTCVQNAYNGTTEMNLSCTSYSRVGRDLILTENVFIVNENKYKWAYDTIMYIIIVSDPYYNNRAYNSDSDHSKSRKSEYRIHYFHYVKFCDTIMIR